MVNLPRDLKFPGTEPPGKWKAPEHIRNATKNALHIVNTSGIRLRLEHLSKRYEPEGNAGALAGQC